MRNVAEVSRTDHPRDEHLDDEAVQCMSRMVTTQRRGNPSIPADYHELTEMEEVWTLRAYELLRIAKAFHANESGPRLHGMSHIGLVLVDLQAMLVDAPEGVNVSLLLGSVWMCEGHLGCIFTELRLYVCLVHG